MNIDELNAKILELQSTMPKQAQLRKIEKELADYREEHSQKIKDKQREIKSLKATMPGLEKRLGDACFAGDKVVQKAVEKELATARENLKQLELTLRVQGEWETRESDKLKRFELRLAEAARESIDEARELVELNNERIRLLRAEYLKNMIPLGNALREAAETCVHAKNYCGWQIRANIKNPEWEELEIRQIDLESHGMRGRDLPYWAGVALFGKPKAANP